MHGLALGAGAIPAAGGEHRAASSSCPNGVPTSGAVSSKSPVDSETASDQFRGRVPSLVNDNDFKQ